MEFDVNYRTEGIIIEKNEGARFDANNMIEVMSKPVTNSFHSSSFADVESSWGDPKYKSQFWRFIT